MRMDPDKRPRPSVHGRFVATAAGLLARPEDLPQ